MSVRWSLILTLLLTQAGFAQQQELGLTLGGFTSSDRTARNGTSFTLGSGTTLQANYEHRLLKPGPASLYWGLDFIANPQRVVKSTNGNLTRDIATIYLVPNVMVKFLPHSRLSPWATVGGGYGDYEQSTRVLGGGPNQASRELARGVLMYGGGVDVPVWRFIALRGEIRDYFTGSSGFNVPVSGGQHNVSAGGGLVLRFGGQ